MTPLRRSLLTLCAVPTALSLSMSPIKASLDGNKRGRIVVLGASGLVGTKVTQYAMENNYSVTGVSRNKPKNWVGGKDGGDNEYIPVDLTDSVAVDELMRTKLPDNIVAIVHCVGVLFDGQSGIGNLNKYVSGVGSVPKESASYDDITRKTVFNALDALKIHKQPGQEKIPFLFVSAAEAGWPEMGGGTFVEKLAPDFLKRYLKAKRAVEKRLGNEEGLRSVIFRPSLIYTNTKMRPPPVLAFTLGSKIGLPFVDVPVCVEDLSAAIIKSIENDDVNGVKREPQIVELANSGK